MPEQGGQKLNLAAGKSAEIELPLFVNRHQDGSAIAAGETIPLWSLDPATGLWRQEGSGTVVASAATPTGFALRATIGHFSWWNGDAVALRGTVNLTVNVSGANLPANSVATVEANVVAGNGPADAATSTVGVGSTGQFRVSAAGTLTRFVAVFRDNTQVCRGTVDVSPPADTTVDATITMTCAVLPVRLVLPVSPTFTNSQSALSFRIEVDGAVPDSVELFANGTRIAQFGPQFFYRGLWDSASFSEGNYALVPKATLNGSTFTGNAVNVIIDRTPPRATTFTPAVNVEVSAATTFTVNFNESVLASPFALSDAIRLTVTPTGSNVPAPIPFTAALSANGKQLTVTPAAALPQGVAGLSWGGLHDAAGNAITGTVAASWTVSRSAQLGADFLFKGNGTRMAFATNAAGVIHAVRQRVDDGNVQVLRFDGSNFVPLGPQVNERAFGIELAMAIDGNGVVHVALEQVNAAGTDGEVVVRRFDANANTWQTLGPPFAIGRLIGSNSAQPRLVIDAAGRPVLSFVGGGGNFELQAHRFDGAAWAALGNIAGFVFSPHSLAVNAAGNPIVAYPQGFAGSNAEALRVAQFNGTAWVSLGQLDSTPNATDGLGVSQIAIAPDGRPWVTWSKRSLQAVSLAAFDGTAFVAVPIVPALPTFNSVAALTFLNGEPVVAGGLVASSGVDVRRFHAGAWEPAVSFASPRAGALTLISDGHSLLVGETVFSFGQAFGRVTRVAFP